MVRITTTHSMSGSGSGPTVAELKEFIAGLPDNAKISLSVQRGSQMDPGGWTMTASQAPVSTSKIDLHSGHGHLPPGYVSRGSGGPES